MPMKKCEMCGSEFQARLSTTRTCKVACRNKLISTEKSAKYQKVNQCVVCTKNFSVGAVDANKQTCSVECGYALRKSKTSKRKAMQCVTCGSGFFTRLSQLRTKGGGKYCSKKCLYERNTGLTERNCICCGKAFSSPPSQVHVKTCSTECGYQWFSGARHHKYIGATKKVVGPDGKVTVVANRWYAAKMNRQRYELLRRATPVWADEALIRKVYELAEAIEASTGMKYHVVHIVPLNSKTVSGLHNQFNLQVLPWLENLSKGNRHWPDKP